MARTKEEVEEQNDESTSEEQAMSLEDHLVDLYARVEQLEKLFNSHEHKTDGSVVLRL